MKKILYLILPLFLLFSFISCKQETVQNIEKEEVTVENTTFSRSAKVNVLINVPDARSTGMQLPEKIYYVVQAFNIDTKSWVTSADNINDLYTFKFDIKDEINGDRFFFGITGYADEAKNIPILTSRYTEGTDTNPKENPWIIKPNADIDITVDLQLIHDKDVTGSINLPISISNTKIDKLIVHSDSDDIGIKNYEYSFDDGNTTIKVENAICGEYLTSFDFYCGDILLYSKKEYITVRQNRETTWAGEALTVTSETVKNNYNPIYVDGTYTQDDNTGTWLNPTPKLNRALKQINCINNEFVLAGALRAERNFTITIVGTTRDDKDIEITSTNNTSRAADDDDGGFTLTIKSKGASASVNDKNITTSGNNLDLTLKNLEVPNIITKSPVTIDNCTITKDLTVEADTKLSNTKISGNTVATAPLTSESNIFTSGLQTSATINSTKDEFYTELSLNGTKDSIVSATFQDVAIGVPIGFIISKNQTVPLSAYVPLTATYSEISLSYELGNNSYIGKTNISNSKFSAECTTSSSVTYTMDNTTFTNCENVIFKNLAVLGEYDFNFVRCNQIAFSELIDPDDETKTLQKSITRKNVILEDSNMDYSMTQLTADEIKATNKKITFTNTKGTVFNKGTMGGDPGIKCPITYFTNTELSFTTCSFQKQKEMVIDGGSVSFYRIVINNGSNVIIKNTESCSMSAGNFNMLGEVNTEPYGTTATFTTINTSNFTFHDEQITDYLPLDKITFSNNQEVTLTNTLIMSSEIIFEKNTSTTLTKSPLCSDKITIVDRDVTINRTPYLLSDTDGKSNVPLTIQVKNANLKLQNTIAQGSVELDSSSSLILNQTSYIDSVTNTVDGVNITEGGIIFMEGDALIKMQNTPADAIYEMEVFHRNPEQDKRIVVQANTNGTIVKNISDTNQMLFESIFRVITPGMTSSPEAGGIYLSKKNASDMTSMITALFTLDEINKGGETPLPSTNNYNIYSISSNKLDDLFLVEAYNGVRISSYTHSATYMLYDAGKNFIGSKAFYKLSSNSENYGVSISDFVDPLPGEKYYLDTYFCTNGSRDNITTVSKSKDTKTINITE